MAFVQKDKLSRKDKLERNNTGEGPDVDEFSGRPRVVIHNEPDGSKHMHMVWPSEGSNSSPHLEALLRRLEEKHAEEEEALQS